MGTGPADGSRSFVAEPLCVLLKRALDKAAAMLTSGSSDGQWGAGRPRPMFHRIPLPTGLERTLEELAREVLRRQPDDIYRFCHEFFKHRLDQREELRTDAVLRGVTPQAADQLQEVDDDDTEGVLPSAGDKAAQERQAERSRQTALLVGALSATAAGAVAVGAVAGTIRAAENQQSSLAGPAETPDEEKTASEGPDDTDAADGGSASDAGEGGAISGATDGGATSVSADRRDSSSSGAGWGAAGAAGLAAATGIGGLALASVMPGSEAPEPVKDEGDEREGVQGEGDSPEQEEEGLSAQEGDESLEQREDDSTAPLQPEEEGSRPQSSTRDGASPVHSSAGYGDSRAESATEQQESRPESATEQHDSRAESDTEHQESRAASVIEQHNSQAESTTEHHDSQAEPAAEHPESRAESATEHHDSRAQTPTETHESETEFISTSHSQHTESYPESGQFRIDSPSDEYKALVRARLGGTPGGDTYSTHSRSEHPESHDAGDDLHKEGSESRPQSATADGSRPQSATADGSRPQSAIADGSRPQSATADGSRPQSATADGSRPQSATADGSRPQSATSNGSRPQSATADGSRPQSATADGSRPQSATADGSRPQSAIADGSRPQSATADGSRPQSATADGSRPQSATADGSRPQSATSNGSRPQSATADGSRPQSATADGSRPQSATADGSRPQSATSNRSRSQSATADGSRPQSVTADGSRPQSATADGSRPQSATADGFRPQSATVDGSRPQSATVDGSRPQSATVDGSRPQSATASGSRPQSATADGSRPQSATVDGSRPQSATVDGSRPQSATVDGSRPQSATVDGSRPQSATADGSRPQSATVDGSRPQSATADGSRPQSATADGSRPQSATADGSRPQSVTVDESRPQPATEYGSRLQSVTVDGSRPQSATADRSRPQSATVDGSRPQSATADGSRPQSATADGSRPQSATADGSRPQSATADGSRPQSATADGSRPQSATVDGSRPQSATADGSRPQSATVDGSRPQSRVQSGRRSEVRSQSDQVAEDVDGHSAVTAQVEPLETAMMYNTLTMTRFGERAMSPGAETEYRSQYRRSDATDSGSLMLGGGSRPLSGETLQQDRPAAESTPTPGDGDVSGSPEQGDVANDGTQSRNLAYRSSSRDAEEDQELAIADKSDEEHAEPPLDESLISLSRVQDQAVIHSAGAVRTSFMQMKKHESAAFEKTPLYEIEESVQRSASQLSASSFNAVKTAVDANATTPDDHTQIDGKTSVSESDPDRPTSATVGVSLMDEAPSGTTEEGVGDEAAESPSSIVPVASSLQEDASSVHQAASSPQPDFSSPKPDISSPKPEISSPQPDISSPQPDISSPQPVISSPLPDISSPLSPLPDVSSPHQDVSSSHHDASSPQPDASSLHHDTSSIQAEVSSLQQDAPSSQPYASTLDLQQGESSPERDVSSPQPDDSAETAGADQLLASDDEYDPLAVTQSVILPAGCTGGRHSAQSEKASSPFPEVENERFSPSPRNSVDDQPQAATDGDHEFLDVEQLVQSRSDTFDLQQGDNATPGPLSEHQDESTGKANADEKQREQVEESVMRSQAASTIQAGYRGWKTRRSRRAMTPAEAESGLRSSEDNDGQVSYPNSTSDVSGLIEPKQAESEAMTSEVRSSSATNETLNGSALLAMEASELNIISPTPTQNDNNPENRTEDNADQSSHLSVPAMGVLGSLAGGSAVALGYALTRRPGSSGDDSGISQRPISPNDSQPETILGEKDNKDKSDDEESGNWFSRTRDEIKGVFTGNNQDEVNGSNKDSGANSDADQANGENEESESWFSRAKTEVNGVLFGDKNEEEHDQNSNSTSQRSDPEGQDSGLEVPSDIRPPLAEEEEEQSRGWYSRARDEIKGVFVGDDDDDQGTSAESKDHEDPPTAGPGVPNDTPQVGAEEEEGEQSGSWFSRAKDEIKGVFVGDDDDDQGTSAESKDHEDPPTAGPGVPNDTPQVGAEEEGDQSGSWFSRARDEIKGVFVGDDDDDQGNNAESKDHEDLPSAGPGVPNDTPQVGAEEEGEQSGSWFSRAKDEIKGVFVGDDDDGQGTSAESKDHEDLPSAGPGVPNDTPQVGAEEGDQSGSWFSRARDEIKGVFVGDDDDDQGTSAESKDHEDLPSASPGVPNDTPQVGAEEEGDQSGSWFSRAKDEIKGVFVGDDDDDQGTSAESKDHEDPPTAGPGVPNDTPQVGAEEEGDQSGSWFSRARDEIKGVFVGDDDDDQGNNAESKDHEDPPTAGPGVPNDTPQVGAEEEGEQSGSWFSRAKDEIKGVFVGDDDDDQGTSAESKDHADLPSASPGVPNDTTQVGAEEEGDQSGSWFSRAKDEIKGVFVGDDDDDQGTSAESKDHEDLPSAGPGVPNDTPQVGAEEEENQSGSWFSRARDEIKGVFVGDDDDDGQGTSAEPKDRDLPAPTTDQVETPAENIEEESSSTGWFSRARNELNSTFQDLKKDVKDTFSVTDASDRK